MNLEVSELFNKIKLKNYKSFVDIEFNISKNKNAKNLVLIYGENGAGKSNMAGSVFTLVDTIKTLESKEYIQQILEKNELINLEQEEKLNLLNLIARNFKETETIIKECKTINSTENMILEYGFELNGKEGVYVLEMDNKRIVREELKFIIDKNSGYHFSLREGEDIKLNSKIFNDNNYQDELKGKIEKFWGRHSVLAIINNDIENYNHKYLNNKISKNLLIVINFIRGLTCYENIGDSGGRGKYGVSNNIFSKLKNGTIDKNNLEELKAMEEFLNEIYTKLYSDIKCVYYDIEVSENEIMYKLYLKKMIGGKILEIDFDLESTGTLKILRLIPAFYEAVKGRTVILDEFDTGIHDLLVKNLLTSVNDYIKGQLILTTHNTLLLESEICSDSIYFLVIDEDGNKNMVCLTDYQKRTHPNHNRRDLYLKGVYDAVPLTRELDFDELEQILDKE